MFSDWLVLNLELQTPVSSGQPKSMALQCQIPGHKNGQYIFRLTKIQRTI